MRLDCHFDQAAWRRSAPWLMAAVTVALVVRWAASRGLATGIWAAANGTIALAAVVWGVAHPRSMATAAGAIVRWSLGVSLLLAVAGAALLERVLAEATSGLFSAAGVGGLAALTLALPLCLAGSLFGAALGGLVGRRGEHQAADLKLGLRLAWAGGLAVGLAVWLPAVDAWPGLRRVLLIGLPALIGAAAALLARRRRPAPAPRWLERALIVRYTVGGQRQRADLRGVGLGLAVGLVVVAASSASLLAPLQGALLASVLPTRGLYRELSIGPERLPQPAVVCLDMDETTQRRAATTSSEVAIQAEVIRRLSQAGAGLIVLPMPSLPPPATAGWPRERAPTTLDPQSQVVPSRRDMRRSERDWPQLKAAVKEAGNVVLLLPPEAMSHRAVAELPVLRVAGGWLASYGSARLPAVPTRWPTEPPAAWALLALVGGAEVESSSAGDSRLVRLARARPSEIAPGLVVASPLGPSLWSGLAQVSYAAVRSGAPLFGGQARNLGGEPGPARWLAPDEYFAGKVVFLDPLEHRNRETPFGPASWEDVWAGIVASLRVTSEIAGLRPWQQAALVLCLATLVGALCTGHSVVETSWRSGLIAFLQVSLSVWTLILRGDLWIDPVPALVAVFAAALVVSQLTLTMEGEQRERNRSLLQRFVAPQVIDELLEDPDARLGLGGRRQQVAVAFADVRDFTGFSEQHSPEEVIETINAYMTAMTEALHAHGGLLDKYTGDGLMAMFRLSGEPGEVISAVRGALAMSAAAHRVTAVLRQRGRTTLEIGLGLHCGEAVVGLVGNPNQFNYTALGYTVVISARLQSLANGGEVVVSEAVREAVGEAFAFSPCERVEVKGISGGVRAWRVAEPAAETPPPA